jgi:hypothetical protein
MFVPRSSITEFQVLALITSPSRRKAAEPKEQDTQEELFDPPMPRSSRPN